MNILLDTHTFIWYVEGSNELSDMLKSILKTLLINVLSVLYHFGKWP